MNSDFKLASVNGMMYTGGNICFTPDNDAILSPVYSYISSIGIGGGASNGIRSHICSNSNIQCFDVSVDGDLMIVIGNRGLGFFYLISAQVILDTISFPPNTTINVVKFSPCSKYVALGLETTLQIYIAPHQRVVSYHACSRVENIHNALTLPIVHIDWTPDSHHLLIAGHDAYIKIYPRTLVAAQQQKWYVKSFNNLIGHRSAIMGAFFMGAYITDITEGDWGLVRGETEEEQDADDNIDNSNNKEFDTKYVISISADNAVLIWRRTNTTRRDMMVAITEAKQDARRATADNENGDDDETAMPKSFLEKEKDKMVTLPKKSKASDVHLPDILRYAYEIKLRFLLQHKGKVSVADYQKQRSLLVVGYDSGIFAVHATGTKDCALLHLLSITSQTLTACKFSPSGDYIAFGSEKLKQLLVWDWKAETNILKEQSHYYDITTTAMTSDGQYIISGSDDGKVKVWNVSRGQCVVTFTEHQAGITSIAASNSTNAFFTASKDGTARGYDLVRYRNFRVYTTSERTQNSCIAVDPSGEVLAVGSSRHSKITLFSVQTGRVIDELEGHEGAVACLAFHPNGTTLASGAMDKSLMIWDIFGGSSGGVVAQEGDQLKGLGEAITTTSEILSLAYSRNGKRMVTLALNSEVTVYDAIIPNEPQILCVFKTSFDATGGWTSNGLGPNSANCNARFTTIAFSPDGDKVVAGGESKWLVLYHATQGYAMKKWHVSHNLDIEGMEEQFKWRMQSEAGNLNDIDVAEDDIHIRKSKLIEMPGSRSRHFATGKRKTELVARTMHVSFADNGRSFVCASTDGLLLFSLDVSHQRFMPIQLKQNLTPAYVRKLIDDKNYVQALIGALYLQSDELITEIMRRTPRDAIPVAVSALPSSVFPVFIVCVAKEVSSSRFVTQSLLWAQALTLYNNESFLKVVSRTSAAVNGILSSGASSDISESSLASTAMRTLHRALQRHSALKALVHDNLFNLKYIKSQCK